MAKTLLDIVRDKIILKHYSPKTEQSYTMWIKKYILFHNKKHPMNLNKEHIESFLTHLAVNKKVSPSTQNQAFNALLFLYEQVLNISLKDQNIKALRAKSRSHIPVVLTTDEVKNIINNIDGIYQTIISLMYGCGLRMNEVLNLRVKDIDFGFNKVYIYDSKSDTDRVLPLPQKIKNTLKLHIHYIKTLHDRDLELG